MVKCDKGFVEIEGPKNKEFVKVNATDSLQNVILCHLGIDTSNAGRMVAEICEVAKNANVDVARAGAEWQLRAKDECPF